MKIILFHLEIFEVRRPKYKKEKALIRQGFPKMRSPFFDKNVRKTDLIHMVRVGRLELPASCSQTVELNFLWLFIVIFNPFRYISITL